MNGWGVVAVGYVVAFAVWVALAVWALRSGRPRP